MRAVTLLGLSSPGGAATLTSNGVKGFVEKIENVYVDADATADYNFISANSNLFTILNVAQASTTWYPRATASPSSDEGEKVFINGPITLNIAQGGNRKLHALVVYLSD